MALKDYLGDVYYKPKYLKDKKKKDSKVKKLKKTADEFISQMKADQKFEPDVLNTEDLNGFSFDFATAEKEAREKRALTEGHPYSTGAYKVHESYEMAAAMNERRNRKKRRG